MAEKSKKRQTYKNIKLKELRGKTVKLIRWSHVDGPWCNEPRITLYFTDGTKHGFVLATDDTFS